MSSWYSRNLGDAMLAGEALDQIKELFLSESKNGRYAPGTAVFMRHDSEGRLHCEVKVFFPPELAELAERVGTIPCEQPFHDSLGVLISS